MKIGTVVILCLLGAAIGRSARADVSGIYVEYYSTSNPGDHWAAVSGFPDRHASEAGLDGSTSISVTGLGNLTYRIVTADPATGDPRMSLPNVSFSCASADSEPNILIAGDITHEVHSIVRRGSFDPYPAANDLADVTFTNGKPHIQISVSGALRGNIDMFDIARIKAPGTLGQNVTIRHNPVGVTPAPELASIYVGFALQGATILADHGNIGVISAANCGANVIVYSGDLDVLNVSAFGGGNFTGSISVSGRIGTITVYGAIQPVDSTHSAPVIQAQDGIANICAGGVINATISAGEAGNIGQIVSGGSISGSITARSLLGSGGGAPAIEIDSGNLNAYVTLSGDLGAKISIPGYLASSKTIRIDGSLTSTGSICVGTGGLQGQVIINGAGTDGEWVGPVKIGPDGTGQIVLEPTNAPYYSQTPSQLGGGAVGLAPFHVHESGSNISNGGYYFRSSAGGTHALPNPIYIRHYGPFSVYGSPTVQYRDPYSSAWCDVSNMFSISRYPDSAHRTLRVQYHLLDTPLPPGHYRVHVDYGELYCENVDGYDGVSVEPYDFYFTVALDCNSNGVPDSGDFLTSPGSNDCDLNGVDDTCDLANDGWFRDLNHNNILDMCEVTGPCPCDFNGDGHLNSQDFFDFLDCFFDHCCSARDFNGDGVVNSQDFFDWLTCFFAGC